MDYGRTASYHLYCLGEARKGSSFVLNFIYHTLMISQTCSLLPSNRNRSTFVHALVTALDLLRSPPSGASYTVSLLRPSPACESDLTAYHDRCYVDALLANPGPDRTTQSEFGLECVRVILLVSPMCEYPYTKCRTARLFPVSENMSSG